MTTTINGINQLTTSFEHLLKENPLKSFQSIRYNQLESSLDENKFTNLGKGRVLPFLMLVVNAKNDGNLKACCQISPTWRIESIGTSSLKELGLMETVTKVEWNLGGTLELENLMKN